MDAATPPLDHHQILRLALQLALLLGTSRVLAELLKRVRQPPVVGELLAGILLGPTLFGRLAPALHAEVFPATGASMQLLETVAWLGMTLLMLLTGLETDVRLLRHLGRPAIMASAFGMVVPFVSGFALGMLLPESLVTPGVGRGLLSAFLATAMAISAMPVISRILLDLNLLKRNIGVLTLSAGVVDDTTGWLILSVIAGAATGGVAPGALAWTLAGLAAFLLAARYVLAPLMAWLLRFIDDEQLIEGTDVTVIVTFALACAAVTQWLGVHAVFGAFVAGVIVRQAPRLRDASVHQIEGLTRSLLSPVFFAFVGLRVDLWELPGVWLVAVFVLVATAGKLIGCYVGGRLGGMTRWESLALGIAMNARGAMELVVATMGLSLGLLDERLFSTLVLVALTTSFAAPLLLAPLTSRLPITREEQQRLEQTGRPPLFASALKIVTTTDGGVAGVRAVELASALSSHHGSSLLVLHAERPRSRWRRHRPLPMTVAQLERLKVLQRQSSARLNVRQVESSRVVEVVRAEAGRGASLVVMGTSAWPSQMLGRSAPAGQLLDGLPCPVAVLRPKRGGKTSYSHLLVPTDGSSRSRLSLEVALAYAAATGARLTLLHVMEAALENPLVPRRGLPSEGTRRMVEQTLDRSLSPLLEQFPPERRPAVHVRVIEADNVTHTIAHETLVGPYDLLVIVASGKAVHERIFFGYGTEFLVEESDCSVLAVLPPKPA